MHKRTRSSAHRNTNVNRSPAIARSRKSGHEKKDRARQTSAQLAQNAVACGARPLNSARRSRNETSRGQWRCAARAYLFGSMLSSIKPLDHIRAQVAPILRRAEGNPKGLNANPARACSFLYKKHSLFTHRIPVLHGARAKISARKKKEAKQQHGQRSPARCDCSTESSWRSTRQRTPSSLSSSSTKKKAEPRKAQKKNHSNFCDLFDKIKSFFQSS